MKRCLLCSVITSQQTVRVDKIRQESFIRRRELRRVELLRKGNLRLYVISVTRNDIMLMSAELVRKMKLSGRTLIALNATRCTRTNVRPRQKKEKYLLWNRLSRDQQLMIKGSCDGRYAFDSWYAY